MKNFEFKSQVATTREQSQKLLQLGLKKETADMAWIKEHEKPVVLSYTFNDKEYGCIPAWSLHRIVEIMFKGDIEGFVGYNIHANNVGIMYKYAISNIEALIKMGSFNKDYLEDKQ